MAKKEPFDLDALEVEATREPFVFKFGGAQFIIPAIADLRVAAHLNRTDFAGAVQLMLGPEQWAALEALDAVFTIEHAILLVTGFTEHLGTTPGKIADLFAVVEEWGEELEADLAQHYGVELAGLATGALSWRRFANLVRHLPRDSSLVRAVDPTSAWSTTEHLLATLVDLSAGGNWQRGGGKGARPKPLPRPGVKDEQSHRVGRTTLPLDEARRRLDALHGRDRRCPKCGRICKSPAGLASHRRTCEKRKG